MPSEPNTPLDPVSGFFAGFTSVFARMFIGIAAFVIGYFICGFSAMGFDSRVWGAFPLLSIFTIFTWATYGGWFVLGMAALISIFTGLWMFVHDSDGKRSFFFILSASAVYFSVLLFATRGYSEDYDDGRHPLTWAAAIYAGITLFYWVVPRLIATFAKRNAQEEIETVAPITEEYAGEESPGTEPSHVSFETGEDSPLTGTEPLEHPADEGRDGRLRRSRAFPMLDRMRSVCAMWDATSL